LILIAAFTAFMFSRVSGNITNEVGYFAVPTIIGCLMLWRGVSPKKSLIVFLVVGIGLGFTEIQRYAEGSDKDFAAGWHRSQNLAYFTQIKADAYCDCMTSNAGFELFKISSIKLLMFQEPKQEDAIPIVNAANKICLPALQ